MRFKSFINESRGKSYFYPDDRGEIIDIIKTKCKNALNDAKKGYIIYRGMDFKGDMYVIDPKKGTRKSANTPNYYTWIIDHDKKWKDYPKRSKSIICSTSERKVEAYGDKYIVFPYDGSKIGVCPEDDIWDSFKNSFGSSTYLGQVNREITLLTRKANKFNKIPVTYAKFLDMLDVLRNHMKWVYDNWGDLTIYDKEDYYSIMLWKIWDKKTPFDKWLISKYDPKDNDFFIAKSVSEVFSKGKKDKEVWTDGVSVLLSISVFEEMIIELGK